MSKLSALQNRLLEMMSALDDFCLANKLCYYALGGTVLGAMRHDGFIPWDDDIDIGMPRRDYDILCAKWPEKPLSGRYIIETTDSTDQKFCYPYAKMYDVSTTLIEKSALELKRGVFIDIFPLDGLGHSQRDSRINYRVIERKRKLLQLKTIKKEKGRAFHKNALLFIAQSLPKKLLSEKKISIEIDKICRRYSFDDYEWGGNLVGAWWFKEVMPIRYFGIPVRHKFESIEINLPEKAEKYLEKQYGNWKQLPPIEKQVSHHDFYLDLNNGYI